MRAHPIIVISALSITACGQQQPPEDERERVEDVVDCSRENVLPLHLTREDGVADVQTVPVTVDGVDAWLALDTGAPFTFLFSDPEGPEFVPRAGSITLGCETWEVPGYREDAIGVEMLDGKPILGLLGIDFFADVPAELDYPGARLVRHFDGELPEFFDDKPTIPLRGLEHDRPLVDVIIDDQPLTMMFDAGAHDTIWLGVEGDPDDERAAVQTADGAIWEVFLGDGIIALPGEAARTVPVMRALDIGYIKPELDDIGAQGLLGLTSMGWRRLAFDFNAGALHLGELRP